MALLYWILTVILKFTSTLLKKMIWLYISILIFIIHMTPVAGLIKLSLGNRFFQFVSGNLHQCQQLLFPLEAHSKTFEDIRLIEGNSKDGFADISLNQFQVRDPLLSLNDVRAASIQIGFPPHNIVRIGAYKQLPDGTDDKSHPYVLILYPVNFIRSKGQFEVENGLRPFPTVTWMSSPELSSRVAKLEVIGYVSKLFDKLNSNPEYMAQMKRAHERYSEFRWNLLSDSDKDLFIKKGW